MKSLINSALLKEQLKRFWTIGALSLLCYVLLIILPIYQINHDNPYRSVDAVDQLASLFGMQNPVMIVASILVPLITVFLTFSYLFQPKATTTLHAYPINKTQLLFTNMLAGFMLMVIPLLILCSVLLIPVEYLDPATLNTATNGSSYQPTVYIPIELFPNGMQYGDIINTLPIVAGFFWRTLLTFAFYYAVFLIAAIMSGSAIIYVLVSAVLPFIPSGLLLLTQIIGLYYCFGFDTSSTSRLLEQLFTHMNPVLFGTLFHFYPSTKDFSFIYTTNFTTYMLSYITIAVVLIVLSFWFNHLRRQERAGDSIVFTPLKNVLIFLLSLLGMIMLGLFFLSMFGGIASLYSGFVLGFVVTYFIAQMIAEKSFHIFLIKAKDLIRFGGVAIGLFLVIFVVTKFDIIGYSTYTLEPDSVEGVYFSYPYEYFNDSDTTISKDEFFIADTEIISDTVAIHKEIVGSRDELRKVFLQNMSRQQKSSNYEMIRSQYFLFKLKNGKIVTRNYSLPQSFYEKSGLNALLSVDKVILAPYRSFQSPEAIGKVVLSYYEEQNEQNISMEIQHPEQIISLLEEVKKDIVMSEQERIHLLSEAVYSQDNSIASTIELPSDAEKFSSLHGFIELKSSKIQRGVTNTHFDLTKFSNTKVWLVNNGYMD